MHIEGQSEKCWNGDKCPWNYYGKCLFGHEEQKKSEKKEEKNDKKKSDNVMEGKLQFEISQELEKVLSGEIDKQQFLAVMMSAVKQGIGWEKGGHEQLRGQNVELQHQGGAKGQQANDLKLQVRDVINQFVSEETPTIEDEDSVGDVISYLLDDSLYFADFCNTIDKGLADDGKVGR